MNNYARSALSAFFLLSTLAGVPATHSGEYYIYRDSKGILVISNQKPPPGSYVIRQRTLADEADHETRNSQKGSGAESNVKGSKPAPTQEE